MPAGKSLILRGFLIWLIRPFKAKTRVRISLGPLYQDSGTKWIGWDAFRSSCGHFKQSVLKFLHSVASRFIMDVLEREPRARGGGSDEPSMSRCGVHCDRGRGARASVRCCSVGEHDGTAPDGVGSAGPARHLGFSHHYAVATARGLGRPGVSDRGRSGEPRTRGRRPGCTPVGAGRPARGSRRERRRLQ